MEGGVTVPTSWPGQTLGPGVPTPAASPIGTNGHGRNGRCARARSAPAIIWTASPEGRITWSSDRWFEYTGIAREDNPRHWPQVLHPDDVEPCVRAWQQALAEGGEYEVEVRNRRHDGQYRWFLTRATPIRDGAGRIVEWYGSTMDIQDRKEAEEELRLLNEQLEERVAERTVELAWQNQSLRQLAHQLTEAEDRQRRQLAKTLHDGLQQILIAGRMQLALYLREPTAEPPDRLGRLLDEAIAACRSLSYELSPPAFSESDLPEALEWLADWFRTNNGFAVTLEVDEAFPVLPEATKTFLFGAVRELLLNCVKHSGSHAATVRLGLQQSQRVHIRVADDGQGFDPTEPGSLGEEAQGFGLFSIRERLAALGGALWIDSRPGAGARFDVTLPLNEAKHRRTPTSW